MVSSNKDYLALEDLPNRIPVFPLTGAILLPRGQLPLNIFEPRYLSMIDAALAGDRMIGMVQPAFDKATNTVNDLCHVGCAGRLVSTAETGDGRYLITLYGIARFQIRAELDALTPFRQVEPDWTPFVGDLHGDDSSREIDRDSLLKTFELYLSANDMEADWDSIHRTETEMLVNALSMMSPYGPAEKQALLEADSLKTRAETLIAITEFSLVQSGPDNDAVLQ